MILLNNTGALFPREDIETLIQKLTLQAPGETDEQLAHCYAIRDTLVSLYQQGAPRYAFVSVPDTVEKVLPF